MRKLMAANRAVEARILRWYAASSLIRGDISPLAQPFDGRRSRSQRLKYLVRNVTIGACCRCRVEKGALLAKGDF